MIARLLPCTGDGGGGGGGNRCNAGRELSSVKLRQIYQKFCIESYTAQHIN